MKWERSDCHFWNSGSTCTPRVYHRMFSHILPLVLKRATDEITCLGEHAITKWGAPYGFCRFWIWIPYWLWSLPKPLQGSKATSYCNFVYSNHVGVMQWAHNSSAAALSHQVFDLRMWSCENVNYTTRGPGCVSSTCDISRRLSTFDIVVFSSCHHDTSNVLTNSTEISWCHVLFWKNLWKNTQVRIQYPVICPVSWVKLYPQSPHLATTLVSWTTATHHLGSKLRPVAPQHLLLGRSEETLEPGLLP